MNGYYQYDDPLTPTRVKQRSAYTSPCRSRTTSRQENNSKQPARSASAIWTVVSSLVHALSDARDELLTLLSSDNVRVARKSDATITARRNCSSRSPSRSPSRPFSAPAASDWRRSRSPTRSYNERISSPISSGHRQKFHTTNETTNNSAYSPPVSFGMNLHFDSVQRGRSPPAGYRRLTGRYQPMTMSPQRGMITPHGLEYFAAAPAGQRRHCSATRFADLLEAETYHLRQRRLAGEPAVAALRSKPSWY